jgi:hypothetical protein
MAGVELVTADALRQIASGTGLERLGGERLLLAGGEHDDPDIELHEADPPDRLESADTRHQQIHQHDVGAQFAGGGDGCLAIVRLAHHLQSLVPFEHPAQAEPEQPVIVDQQYADHSVLPECFISLSDDER